MSRRYKSILGFCGLLAAPGCVLFLALTLWFGSATAALAWISGQTMLIEPVWRNDRECELHVKNLTTRTISVLGFHANCDCTVVAGERQCLAPRKGHLWVVKVDRNSLDRHGSEIRIYTDEPGNNEIRLTLNP